ncbi:MAG: hypothetical protein ABI679_02045 [Gemmatimonadota bacterium]
MSPLWKHAEGEPVGAPAVRQWLTVAILGAALVTACSNLAGDSDTPIQIEIRTPAGPPIPPPIEIGDTIQLLATAFNQSGDTVPATFRWLTPDTAFIAVDSLTGRITGKKIVTSARIQVRSGSLLSDLVPFAVVPAADSLEIVGSDSFRVALADTASSPLIAQLDTLNPDGPVGNRALLFQLGTVFGVAGDTVTLNGGVASRTVLTGANGQPVTSVYVRPLPSLPRPDSVLVRVDAFRPSGAAIPGSGQQFIVRFD